MGQEENNLIIKTFKNIVRTCILKAFLWLELELHIKKNEDNLNLEPIIEEEITEEEITDEEINKKIQEIKIYRFVNPDVLNSVCTDIKTLTYDESYYVGLLVTVNNKEIIVEKQSYIRISDKFSLPDNAEYMTINNIPDVTLEEMLERTEERMGKKYYFSYNCMDNNSRIFVKNLLESIGVYKLNVAKFIYNRHTLIID